LDAAVPRQLKNLIREAQEEPREVREERDLFCSPPKVRTTKLAKRPKRQKMEEQQVDTQECELEVAETAAETEEAAATEVEQEAAGGWGGCTHE
jgi:hypothetical protein